MHLRVLRLAQRLGLYEFSVKKTISELIEN